MKICKIWDADYPWDIRVEKVANSLAAAGHTVDLVCRNQARRERREWNGSFTIHRLPALPRTFGPSHTLWNFPYPVNPAWLATMSQVVRRAKSDMILVRDILLALPAILLGKIHRIPVVLDMAENYPAMLEDRRRYTPTTPLGRIVRHPAIARTIERLTIRSVDHIVVVVEESRDRLAGLGTPPERLSIVSNTPILDRWSPNAAAAIAPSRPGGVNLVYLGNLDGSRGVDTAIRAVARLKQTGVAAHLAVIGDGPSRRTLEELTRSLHVEDRVALHGRLPFSEVQGVMAASDVGLIPHYATDAWNTTIPNKLFDYMLLGFPVMVSDAKPTARIVREERCGEVYADRADAELAQRVAGLVDPAIRREQGDKGRDAVYRRYNWAHDSKVLLDALEAAVAGYRSRYGRRRGDG